MAGAVARKLCLGHSVFPFPGSDAGVAPLASGCDGQGCRAVALRQDRVPAEPRGADAPVAVRADGTGGRDGEPVGWRAHAVPPV